MRNGYQPVTKQQEDSYLKNSNNIDPKKVKCSTGKFLWYGLGTFMRNGYQPETKQQEDPYLKNSNNLEPGKVKCSAGKFLYYG